MDFLTDSILWMLVILVIGAWVFDGFGYHLSLMRIYGKFHPKPSKFMNKRVSHAGYSFASKGESELFDMLSLLQNEGSLTELKVQSHVKLTDAQITYIADFKAFDVKRDIYVWFEFKGFETPEWRLKRRLWMHYGPGPLLVYKKSGTLFLAEEIIPK